MFPLGFKAYPQQIEFAQALANAADRDEIIILESPTGTGKTISLLAGAVQWLKGRSEKNHLAGDDVPDWLREQAKNLQNDEFIKENTHPLKKLKSENQREDSCFNFIDELPVLVPKVYYASRTHSQLSQVLEELAKFDSQSGTILASRQHLCINEKINGTLKGESLNERCHELLESNSCPHFNNRVSKPKLEAFLHESPQVTDIEDLVSIGKRIGLCPYYANKAKAKGSRFILLPYPSLLLPQIRRGLNLSLHNSLVMLDEAHNLPETINALYSFSDISLVRIEQFLSNLSSYSAKYQSKMNPKNSTKIHQIMAILTKFSSFCSDSPGLEFTFIDLLKKNSLLGNFDFLELSTFAEEYRLSVKCGLNSFPLSTILTSFHLKHGSFVKSSAGNMSFLSFDPSEALDEILSITRRLVFAGGTLARDFGRLILPIGTNYFTRSFGHLIQPSQFKVLFLSQGVTGNPLKFTFDNRTPEVFEELSRCIKNFEKIIPGGIVIFFPSYQALSSYLSSRPEFTRPLYYEKDNAAGNPSDEDPFEAYKRNIDVKRWSILFSVLGGKLSEGVNFSDAYARAVIIVGMPYPNLNDRSTTLKAIILCQEIKCEL